MELVNFLQMASSEEFMALLVQWGSYALLVFLIIVVLLVAMNSTGQARVNSRRF